MVGIDDLSNTWTLTQGFDQGTYTSTNPLKVDAVTEFTATEVSLHGLRAEGYLYKHVVEALPAVDSMDDATLK
jgi:hypothetical protein